MFCYFFSNSISTSFVLNHRMFFFFCPLECFQRKIQLNCLIGTDTFLIDLITLSNKLKKILKHISLLATFVYCQQGMTVTSKGLYKYSQAFLQNLLEINGDLWLDFREPWIKILRDSCKRIDGCHHGTRKLPLFPHIMRSQNRGWFIILLSWCTISWERRWSYLGREALS